MKPRLPGGVRIREPRIDPQPPQHERDDERLTRPVEVPEPVGLPDGGGDSEDDPDDDQPVEPMREELMAPRASGRPATSSAPRRQVCRRDVEHPIPPPEDADERDEDWSAMSWKKSVK